MQIFALNDFSLQMLRGQWLWLLPPLWLIAWQLGWRARAGGWARYIAPDKLRYLTVGRPLARRGWVALWTLALSLAIVAMAGPSWQQLPLTALKNRQAMVVLFDLSPSMLATDIRPSRLLQARLKLIDLLKTRRDGETALVAYAANAYRVSPLTDDPRTIAALVPTLHPDIMPAPGSQSEEAVALAVSLFDGANLTHGDIVLITDGVDNQARQAIARDLPDAYRLSILAVGTRQGSPIPAVGGGYLRNQAGQLVSAPVDHEALGNIAANHNGRFAPVSIDNSDIDFLSGISQRPFLATDTTSSAGADSHIDGGWWLVLLLLPIAALAFQRNAVWCLVVVLLLPAPEPAQARDWSWLWRNDDQRGAQALQGGQSKLAARLFRSPRWSGVAHFRSGDLPRAIEQFALGTSADDLYNLATTLAVSGQLEAALDVFDQTLTMDPAHTDARHNRALVRRAIKQIRDQQDDANQQRDRKPTSSADQEQSQAEGVESGQGRQAQQSAQVGGTSTEGQSDGQQPIDQQRGESTRSQTNNAPPPKTGGASETPVARTEIDGDKPPDAITQAQGGRNDVLNPYSEQWLRNLPADPGALMRRKFRHQAKVRGVASDPTGGTNASLPRARRY